ncbi:MAG TPA: hypothetical protein ENJ00_10525 [Phycisphaerales bacterium]|nr:hypothetical protein [Phycisphaerales bacterium]
MTLLSVVASAWAVAMVVFGFTLLVRAPGGWFQHSVGLPGTTWKLLGVASIGGGQFIFMFMVADRIFPKAGRLVSIWATELIVGGIGLFAMIATGIMALVGLLS